MTLDAHGYVRGAPGALSMIRSGAYIDPLNPDPARIYVRDIALGLSRLCRYGGHVEGFLSVARHSLNVARILRDEEPIVRLCGLLHDASEAYLGDIPRPLKQLPEFAAYRAAEDRLSRTIAARFGLPFPFPPVVHAADDYVLLEIELPSLRHCWRSTPDRDEADFLDAYRTLKGLLS